jgi:CRP-like cAMP-binding protein
LRDAKARDWPVASFLGSLSPPQRDDLLSRGAAQRHVRDKVLIDQGAQSRTVFVLLDGVVKISAFSSEGHESVLGLRTRGDLIGEMAFVTRSARSARVVAITPVEVRVLTESAFAGYLADWPNAASDVAAAVARKLRAANERRAEFVACSAATRVSVILGEVAHMIGRTAAEGLTIGHEVTQADLASLASVSLRTLEKVLKDLEHEGKVKRQRRALIITDPELLGNRWGKGDGDPQFAGLQS